MIVVETRPRAPDFSPLSTCCSPGWAIDSATAMGSPPPLLPARQCWRSSSNEVGGPATVGAGPARRGDCEILRFSHKVDPSATVSVVFHLNRDRSSGLAGL